MARPGLMQNRKWKRLVRALGSPALARGSLELLWDACYEAGNDYLGSDADVELLAQWEGVPGALASALAGAGGEGCAGFIEPDPQRPGWRIHDLFQNAPEYVQRRLIRELARNQRGETISSLRSAAGRKGRAAQLGHSADAIPAHGGQTADKCPTNGGQTATNGDTPAPAPSTSSLRSDVSPRILPEDSPVDQVLTFWREIAVPGGLPSVLELGEARKTHLKARLREKGWIELFREAVTYAASHPDGAWMRGEGSRPWRADLDYFLRPGTVLKTVERARAAGGRKSRASPQTSSPPRRCASADAAHREQLRSMGDFPTLPPAGAT